MPWELDAKKNQPPQHTNAYNILQVSLILVVVLYVCWCDFVKFVLDMFSVR